MCLYLTKRNSTYYFRRVIPPELRSILGAREFTFSLGTKDKDEAKRLRSAHAVRTDQLIDDAWASLSPETRSATPLAAATAISEEELEWQALDRQEMSEKAARREELTEYIDFLKDRLSGATREMPRELRAFPLLKPNIYGRLTAKWGEHWSKYRREICGVTDPRMVFHSFRHTFKDYCRLAGIEETLQRALMGHSSQNVAEVYGSGAWDHQLVEAIARYKVPGLKIASAE